MGTRGNLHGVKVEKQSHYRPGQALRVPGSSGSHISRQSAHGGGRVVSPTHRPPLPQQIFLVLISVRSWISPRAIVGPEGVFQWNIPMTPSGIAPAIFRILAQSLKQLHHRVPLELKRPGRKSNHHFLLVSRLIITGDYTSNISYHSV